MRVCDVCILVSLWSLFGRWLAVQVSSRWFLGGAMCDAWTTLDLICCTSSILHLLVISLDRYWAVTQLDYIHHRSKRRISSMIVASWAGSVIISAPPLFIDDPPDITGQCLINQDLVYTIFSTVGAFYLPFALIMVIYVQVFRAARARIRRKQFRSYAAAAAQRRGVTRAVSEHSLATTQPMSATNGDLDVDEDLELAVQAEPHPDTDERDQIHGLSSGGDGDSDMVKLDPLNEFVVDDAQPVRQRHLCLLTEAQTGSGTRRSESNVVVGQTDNRASTRSICNDEVVVTLRGHEPADDVFEELTLADDGHLERRCVHGRGTADGLIVCTVTSPVDDQVAPPHCNYVDGTTSSTHGLCLPRKAADRLLTPTSTPPRRSSWIDLTRALLPSAAALRVRLHGAALAGRAGGRSMRQMVEQRRERKAARTLAVITGTFVLCWLPFFVVAVLRPFCGDHCYFPAPLISVIVWLGYVNSLLNPIIYTVFNADFRSAFRKILFGKYRSRPR